MTALDLTFWRWTLAAVPLLLPGPLRGETRLARGPAPVAGASPSERAGMSGYTLLLYGALGHTSAVNAALITAANPALIVVLAIVLTRREDDAARLVRHQPRPSWRPAGVDPGRAAAGRESVPQSR